VGIRLLPWKHGPPTNTDQISRTDQKGFSLVDSGSQGGSHKNPEVFFHIDAGGIANKGIALDNIEISKPTYNMDGAKWSVEEEGAGGEEKEKILARMIRSPQEFDDDVEMTSSEEKRYKTKGKRKGNGKGNKKNKSDEQ